MLKKLLLDQEIVTSGQTFNDAFATLRREYFDHVKFKKSVELLVGGTSGFGTPCSHVFIVGIVYR